MMDPTTPSQKKPEGGAAVSLSAPLHAGAVCTIRCAVSCNAAWHAGSREGDDYCQCGRAAGFEEQNAARTAESRAHTEIL